MRIRLLAATGLLLAVLVADAAFAKGPAGGHGKGAGQGRAGKPAQTANTKQGKQAKGTGGWWNKVQPRTERERAFVQEVSQLHEQIRNRQRDSLELRLSGGDDAGAAAKDREVQQLQARLHETLRRNRELHQQMMKSVGAGPKYGGAGWKSDLPDEPKGGGWWTKVQPTSEQERVFVQEVASLHDQIRTRQRTAIALRTSGGSSQQIAAEDKEVQSLQTRLHDLLSANRETHQRLMESVRSAGAAQ